MVEPKGGQLPFRVQSESVAPNNWSTSVATLPRSLPHKIYQVLSVIHTVKYKAVPYDRIRGRRRGFPTSKFFQASIRQFTALLYRESPPRPSAALHTAQSASCDLRSGPHPATRSTSSFEAPPTAARRLRPAPCACAYTYEICMWRACTKPSRGEKTAADLQPCLKLANNESAMLETRPKTQSGY